MIIFKQILSKEEKQKIKYLLQELIDPWGDFYITKDNIRMFIRENKHLLFFGLSKGDKIAFSNNAIAYITGYADKSKRKYLKLLFRKPKDVSGLLTVIGWNLNVELYIKIKDNNLVKKILLKNGFRIRGNRGKEILLYRPQRNLKRGK